MRKPTMHKFAAVGRVVAFRVGRRILSKTGQNIFGRLGKMPREPG
jgi:hypothetical protein